MALRCTFALSALRLGVTLSRLHRSQWRRHDVTGERRPNDTSSVVPRLDSAVHCGFCAAMTDESDSSAAIAINDGAFFLAQVELKDEGNCKSTASDVCA